jgi:hypothetical protein
LQLSGIGDVGEDVAAASPVARDRPAIAGRRQHLDGLGVGETLARPFDPSGDALSGNRTPDEDDLPVMARQHATAGGWLLDVEGDNRAGLYQFPLQQATGYRLRATGYGS